MGSAYEGLPESQGQFRIISIQICRIRLHDKELRVEDQEEEMARLNACVQHGIRTYWLRRCILDSLMRTSLKTQNNVVTEFQKKMLKAYHNVCAYLSESGKPGKAGLLGREVLEETRSLMSQRTPQEGAINFLKSIGWWG